MDPSLLPFFKPQGVVVVGASISPGKLGYGVARNLVQSGYAGAIHFVGQRPGELFDRPLYADLSQVPQPVDLALLIVPPQVTAQALRECGQRGIRAAVVLSSGFREVGAEGATLEQACLEAARQHGLRLLGPNCIGLINTHLPLDTSFLQPPMPAAGPIGFISQSGAFCAAIIDWSRKEGFGFSQIVSLGNQADMSETDALAALAHDEHTRVIVMYMESVSDGRRFVETARELTRHKPVIALKVGRSESGQRAAASHTGALAASDTAFDAAFEKAGILRADSAAQMFDWARALADCPLPAGRRTAVLTNAGGPGVIAVDALEKNGLQLAQLRASTLEALSARLPAAASLHNPVDMLASASPDTYAGCLESLLQDEGVDGVLVILPPPPMFSARDVAERLVKVVPADEGRSRFGKPVVLVLMGSMLVDEARGVLERAGVPAYPFPERAASGLGALIRRAEFLATERQRRRDQKQAQWPAGSVVRLCSTEELLDSYGIEAVPIRLARSLEEALESAKATGYPLVMKIASPDIVHRSDVGGVVLDIQDAASLRIAYTQIVERAQAARPDARIEGVHLQRQIADGQEVIVGALRDAQFGPLLMFGSGGVEVEGLGDVAFALAPLTLAEARQMMQRTWAGRKLQGFRHLPPADGEAAAEVLVRLSQLMVENASITEIEINPLRVMSRGAVAVDVRMSSDETR